MLEKICWAERPFSWHKRIATMNGLCKLEILSSARPAWASEKWTARMLNFVWPCMMPSICFVLLLSLVTPEKTFIWNESTHVKCFHVPLPAFFLLWICGGGLRPSFLRIHFCASLLPLFFCFLARQPEIGHFCHFFSVARFQPEHWAERTQKRPSGRALGREKASVSSEMIAINNGKVFCLDQNSFPVWTATLLSLFVEAFCVTKLFSPSICKNSNPTTVIIHFRNYRADLSRWFSARALYGTRVTGACDKCSLIRIHSTTERHNKLNSRASGKTTLGE